MNLRPHSSTRFWPALAVAAALLAILAPATAAAGLEPKQDGALTPGLAELASSAVRSAPPAEQARRIGVAAAGAGSLLRAGSAVVVEVRFERGAIAGRAALAGTGARVLAASRELQTVTAAVDPVDLPAVAALPGVAAVSEALTPVVRGATTAAGGAGTCEGGEAISEGLSQLGVDAARAQFGLRGKGITVGILSDSFDTATGVATDAQRDIEGNDLPGPAGTCSEQLTATRVLSEYAGGSDEGRAMAQIVHDLAPHAELAFASAFLGELPFAQSIEQLAAPVASGGAGAEVITDDVSYFEEPFFQDGPVAVAIDRVSDAGASYFTAAGNDNAFQAGKPINSWEAPAFRNSGACPAAVAALEDFDGQRCLDFAPGAGTDRGFGITVKAGATLAVDLQWAEPWNGVVTDLDAFLLDSGGALLTAAYRDNSATQRPVEILQWKNTSGAAQTVQLVVNRYSPAATAPRLKFILLRNAASATEYPESTGGDVVGPTIYGHAAAASAISVAAVPYSNSSAPESYSSRGPATHYFGPVEGVGPAAPLGAPEVLAKPDLAATDCGATTFFAQFFTAAWRFCGTSAAAPHAAAIAALIRQGAPDVDNAELRTGLAASAKPVGGFGPEAVGAGLVDAVGALQSVGAVLTADDPPSAVVESTPSEGGQPAPVGVAPPPAAPAPPGPAPVAGPASVPATIIVSRPAKVVRTRGPRARVVLRFRAEPVGGGFSCRFNRSRYGRCAARTIRRLAPGRHTIRVVAVDDNGVRDPTPAILRVRVVRID